METEYALRLLEHQADLPDKNRKVIEIFLAAINDWPQTCNTFEEYDDQLQQFIGAAPQNTT